MPTKKYKLVTGNTTPAADDASVVFGRNGVTWAGSNPDFATGATGNPANGAGLANVAAVQVFEADTAEKIISILVGTLTDAQINYLRISKDVLGNYKNKKVIGVEQLGLYNPDAVENDTPAPSLIKDPTNFAVVKDAIIIVIANSANTRALVQGKYINLRVTIQQ